MNIGNMAMLASIIASMVAVPVATGSLTGDYNAAVGKITAAPQNVSDVPRKISESVSADSLTKTIETASGTARFDISDSVFTATMETPGATVETQRHPDKQVKELLNGDMSLTIVEEASGTTQRCRTASGTLERSVENGARDISFTGTHRAQVRERCDNARETLEQELETLAELSADVDLVDPSASITSLDRDEESVIITNDGPVPVDLGGWTLRDAADNTFTFPAETLQPGDSTAVYSDDAAADCPHDGHCWQQTSIWNSDGDTATLANENSETVDTLSYGG